MPAARSYVEHNTRERERVRGLVERLGDDELRRPVNEHWTVAGVLGHIAFWDARALVLADKLERGVPFSPSNAEPEEGGLDQRRHPTADPRIAPREAAKLALRLAEETDHRVASLSPALAAAMESPSSPLNPLRAAHRAEHLDEIEHPSGG